MVRTYSNKRRQDPETKIAGTRGFGRGLNQISHPSTIRKDELAESQNVFYTQNGVLTKRPGSVNLGVPRGDSTIIRALGKAYNINGNDYLLRISDDGILQRYNFSTGNWVDVTNSPTFSDIDSQILQAYGYVYILNQTDDMVKWDGTTFYTFTAIDDPTEAPSVAKVGSGAGAVTYFYRGGQHLGL